MDTIQPLVEQIKQHKFKNALITTHHKPDGDAMGSSLGLMHFLKKFIDTVHVITPTDYAHFLQWIPGNDEVLIYEENKEKSIDWVNQAELVFCLDFNALHRINELGNLIEQSTANKVLIDHHMYPEEFAQFSYTNTGIGSTCELVYELIENYFSTEEIEKKIATCLYTGMVTDTGHFAHSNTRAKTHLIAADLMNRGADNVWIYENVFNTFTRDRSKLFGYCLYKKLEILDEYKTALLYLDSEELKQFNVKTGDTEGLVNFGLGIQGVVFSVLIIDRTEKVKMSFRSKGNFAANAFAKAHFNGGGHYNAAGGASEDTLENTVLKFKNEIKNYKKELLS